MAIDERYRWNVVNVVGVARVADELDLGQLAVGLQNAEYEPEVFPGLTIRVSDPPVHVLLFRSGMMRLTGAKSESSIKGAAKEAVSKLRDLGVRVRPRVIPQVVNVVVRIDFGMPLDLETLARSFPELTLDFEPEQFPGLIVRGLPHGAVALLFRSGKGAIVGLRSTSEAEGAAEWLIRTMELDLD